MITEADTCRIYVLPKLEAAGWDNEPHSFTEQKAFTDGQILLSGSKVKTRGRQKRADYLLRYSRDFMIAVVEAKAAYFKPGDGMAQAKEYAEILDLKFAYSTNGKGIVEFDFTTGTEREIDEFPAPQELFERLIAGEGITDEITDLLLTSFNHNTGKTARYYQEIAINRVVQKVLQRQNRILLTMATGTGKTLVAFQICWKLWSARWNRTGEHRRPRILYLADRNFLIDDPKDKIFAHFGDARWKIENGNANKSRELYFSTYQSIAEAANREGLYKAYPKGFFDLVIVDECHRGSAREDSNWREILEYFEPAFQLGLTATPLRDETRDTYEYFGNPIYTYSLKQGIEDGFLAPYRVHRIVTNVDSVGWRPDKGQLDRHGRVIPDDVYHTKDFEKVVSLPQRTEAIAKHLSEFMKKEGRFDKTIVFCVDQEHADEMRRALNNLNTDLTRRFSDYVCRVVSDEKAIGRGHLSRFQDVESISPVIVTTSQLLTTGIDIETCKNIVLARVVGTVTEFKQIIGRGTRVNEDKNKFFFNILDYTGSATHHFADSEFNGFPALITEVEMDETGTEIEDTKQTEAFGENTIEEPPTLNGQDTLQTDDEGEPRKLYVKDGKNYAVVAHMVYELDTEGKQLRVFSYADYTAEKIRTLYPSAANVRKRWADAEQRKTILEMLAEHGIEFDELAETTAQPNADPFDLLCHVAFNAPLRTRRERADRVRRDEKDFFEQFGAQARQILTDILEKYAEHGTTEFKIPEILDVPPISDYGNVIEINRYFGGARKLRKAVDELQDLLYAA